MAKSSNAKSTEIIEFEKILKLHGSQAALSFLNSRTPHRFTGVYRFDGDMLRNLHFVDKLTPDVIKGDDLQMAKAYSSRLKSEQSHEFVDIHNDPQRKPIAENPVNSYYGILICDTEGQPFGALCHFDYNRCQIRANDMPMLKAAAALIYSAL